MRSKKKILKYGLIAVAAFVLLFGIYFYNTVMIDPPAVTSCTYEKQEPVHVTGSLYSLGDSWIRKSASGLYELYVKGDAYERGVVTGKLAKGLVERQEDYFVSQLHEMIPSDVYINFLKLFVAWFNRNLDSAITEEYKKEIYGVSRSAPDRYDSIGPKYMRILNYHAAHDIGHALLNMHLVGCTSFSLKGKKTVDGKLIAGRNFDFYMGDDFSKEKIVELCEPASGYRFLAVTWGGMIGVVSGMNENGLAVTINAAPGSIPSSAETPISLITREILQYAGNIAEAHAIAAKRKSFVSESIMVSSAADGKTVLIEKTPDSCVVYDPGTDTVISTNHFQKTNRVEEESSAYRYRRVEELLSVTNRFDENKVATVLRDRKGLGGRNIGNGNEKAVNQLIAHHSIIFKPEERIVWVSSSPWQCGKYYAYDLKKIFSRKGVPVRDEEITDKSREIGADPFVKSEEMISYEKYRTIRAGLKKAIKDKTTVDDAGLKTFIASNPEMYLAYQTAGDYLFSRGEFVKARDYYTAALTKEVARKSEREKIEESIRACDKSAE
ncbi:MAG TPA: C45 family autoproteolytic acyltransferase/hydrolase [Spirochaetota bacterium]|nr:C45 family autoproteolytic acyltransferase/hydrolase [Spirochaetota bacterium]